MQISSDAWHAYVESIDSSFGRHRVNYGQIVKSTHPLDRTGREWGERRIIFGRFDDETINTSYIERQNLSTRHFMRRLVRRCLCFSKKLENLQAATALYVLYFNLSWQPREFVYQTPAQRLGLVKRRLGIDELFTIVSS